jgi:hypothetical protein
LGNTARCSIYIILYYGDTTYSCNARGFIAALSLRIRRFARGLHALKRHVPFAKESHAKRARGTAAIAAVLVSGCANSPSLSVLGAYFPDWLFCLVAGVVLTVVVHLIVKRLRAQLVLWPAAVVYPTLVTFLSLAVWLMLFQH